MKAVSDDVDSICMRRPHQRQKHRATWFIGGPVSSPGWRWNTRRQPSISLNMSCSVPFTVPCRLPQTVQAKIRLSKEASRWWVIASYHGDTMDDSPQHALVDEMMALWLADLRHAVQLQQTWLHELTMFEMFSKTGGKRCFLQKVRMGVQEEQATTRMIDWFLRQWTNEWWVESKSEEW